MTGLLVAIVVTAIVTVARLIAERHSAGFVLIACALLLALVRWHAANFGYRCPACEHEFEISTFRDLISPHTPMPPAKYLRCPSCGERSWASVLKKTNSIT